MTANITRESRYSFFLLNRRKYVYLMDGTMG